VAEAGPAAVEAAVVEAAGRLSHSVVRHPTFAGMNTFPQPLDAHAQDSHRWRNTLHTWLMIAGSALLMSIIAWLIFGASGIVWASLLTGFGLWQASRISPAMVLKLYKARRLTAHEVPQLTAIIDELAARANLPATPKLYYVPSQMMNAFAVGKPQDSAVAVTDALIRNLSLRQINGVLAHEVSHIRNGDLKVMALADTLSRLTGSISTFGLLFGMPALFLTGAGPASWLAVLFILAAPTIGGLLQLALSRTREYDADLDAAGLTGDPEGLASALQVLEQKQAGMWEKLTLPGARMPDPSLLRSHPRTEDRVARLLSLRSLARPATAHPEAPHKPGVSIVPPVRRPRIHASRLGVWY
jgi:heat shock protein HtpX